MLAISTHQLSKCYGRHRVLDRVNLAVQQKRLVGFLGPNGAGKTTTIRILLGLLTADSGEAVVLGKSCQVRGTELRREIGYLPGDIHFYPTITGRQTLEFFARVRGVDCRLEFIRLAELLELPLDKIVRKYSSGMRQKLGLIQALMHRPPLLILDEPTSSMDPLIRQRVFAELQDTVKNGRTVLFSSHSLDEVQQICDEVIIVRAGQIVEQQTVEGLRQKALRRVEIRFADDAPLPGTVPLGLQSTSWTDRQLVGTWEGSVDDLLHWVSEFRVVDMFIERPDLNDLFTAYYREIPKPTTILKTGD